MELRRCKGTSSGIMEAVSSSQQDVVLCNENVLSFFLGTFQLIFFLLSPLCPNAELALFTAASIGGCSTSMCMTVTLFLGVGTGPLGLLSAMLLDLLSDERGRGDGVFELGADVVGVVGTNVLLMSPFMSSGEASGPAPALFKFWA